MFSDVCVSKPCGTKGGVYGLLGPPVPHSLHPQKGCSSTFYARPTTREDELLVPSEQYFGPACKWAGSLSLVGTTDRRGDCLSHKVSKKVRERMVRDRLCGVRLRRGDSSMLARWWVRQLKLGTCQRMAMRSTLELCERARWYGMSRAARGAAGEDQEMRKLAHGEDPL